MKNYSVACVVVTYNRKKLLKRCLDAILNQTYKPLKVYILDNASTDGTIDSIKGWGYYNCKRDEIDFKYILNTKNEGGAGGFFKGMKYAFEDGEYDGLWVMDDDGEPDKHCLENLTPYLDNNDYIAPIVLSDEDRKTCSFVPDTSYPEFCEKSSNGIVEDWASPFNGILYSSKLIRTIGYPKKELFIWGDEVNYHIRAKKAKFIPITIVNAIHYHPINRQIYREIPYHNKIILTDADWKLYCFIRNRIYNMRFNLSFIRRLVRSYKMVSSYWYYYNNMCHDSSKNKLLVDAMFCGIVGRFTGMKKYWT